MPAEQGSGGGAGFLRNVFMGGLTHAAEGQSRAEYEQMQREMGDARATGRAGNLNTTCGAAGEKVHALSKRSRELREAKAAEQQAKKQRAEERDGERARVAAAELLRGRELLGEGGGLVKAAAESPAALDAYLKNQRNVLVADFKALLRMLDGKKVAQDAWQAASAAQEPPTRRPELLAVAAPLLREWFAKSAEEREQAAQQPPEGV